MSEDTVLPGWVSNLKPLAGSVGFLVALASDPAEELRNVILDVVLGYVLGGVVDVFSSVFGLLLDAGSQAATVPALMASALVDLGDAVGSPVLALLGAGGEFLASVVGLAGPFGPVAAFVLAAVLIYVAVEVSAIAIDTVFPAGGDALRSLRGLFR
jgi:hypothetical protein